MKSRFGTGAEESPSPLEEGVVKGTDLHSLIPSPQAPSLRSGKALSRRARGFYDTPPEGQMGESDLQALRTLSEEIARDFAPRLEQTTLVLYDRDPEHFQAQWYVMPETLAEARGLFPKDGADPRQVLRLCRLDREGRTEVVASTSQGSDEPQGTGQYDFTLHGDGGEYLCELGLVSDEGGWLLLARSNRVRLAERNPPVLRTTPAPDDTQAQDGPRATSEQPEAIEEMPVEPALAAVGEPLNPVFPNLELDDALTPRHPAPPEERPGQAQPQDRRSEYPPGVPPYVASYPGRGDVPPPKHPTPQEGVAKGTDLHPLIPSPQPPSPTPLPAGKGLLRHPPVASGA